MPAVYAHRRFGAEVLACCRNGAARAAIGAFHTLYEVGLQGPDILFYYDPLHKNPWTPAAPCTTRRLPPSLRAGLKKSSARPRARRRGRPC